MCRGHVPTVPDSKAGTIVDSVRKKNWAALPVCLLAGLLLAQLLKNGSGRIRPLPQKLSS
jgi:hypothetical protein